MSPTPAPVLLAPLPVVSSPTLDESSSHTLTLVFKTLPSANGSTRFGNGHSYARKDIVEAKEEARATIRAQVQKAKWQTCADDWYDVVYQFGTSSLLRCDSDNIEKTTNDCLSRGTWRRKKNKKTGEFEQVWHDGGDAIWDDKRIYHANHTKHEDVYFRTPQGSPLTIVTITKIPDPRTPKVKYKRAARVARIKKEVTYDTKNIHYPAH